MDLIPINKRLREKFCNGCKKTKDIKEFNIRIKRGKYCYRSRCKKCECLATKLWNIKNSKFYLARKRFRKLRDREKYNFYERKRKMLKKKVGGNHTYKEWLKLKKLYGNMCLCCKRVEPEIKLTEDHIIPISKGGSNNIENIQPLCVQCNQIKTNKFIDFRRKK